MVGGGYFVKVTERGYIIRKAEYNRANNKRVGVKLKAFQDSIIDDMVADPNRYEIPSDSVLYAGLENTLKPQVYNNYKSLLSSPYIKNDSVQEMLILSKANKDTARIVEAELAQMKSNLDYVQNVLNKYDIVNKEYKKVLNETGKLSNRKQVIEAVSKNITTANNMASSPTMNIPRIQPYYDLDFVSEKLLRENRMTSSYESMEEINRVAEQNGEDPVYTKKTWVWTGLGKTTRHESNDGQTVDFDDYFTIVNDATDEVDELLHPCDPNGSPSNTTICYCEMETK